MALPFRLLVITDWSLGETTLLAKLEAALAAGPGLAVQHRHPAATARVFWNEGEALAKLCARFGAPLFVNGRLDVALGLGAHLHLTSRSLAVDDVRPLLPAGRLVSRAVHDATEAEEARGCDLALVSPVFRPGSKPDDTRPLLGADGVARLAAVAGVPAFALGGVDAARAGQLAGVAGAAVIGAVLRAADPRAAAEALLRALG